MSQSALFFTKDSIVTLRLQQLAFFHFFSFFFRSWRSWCWFCSSLWHPLLNVLVLSDVSFQPLCLYPCSVQSSPSSVATALAAPGVVPARIWASGGKCQRRLCISAWSVSVDKSCHLLWPRCWNIEGVTAGQRLPCASHQFFKQVRSCTGKFSICISAGRFPATAGAPPATRRPTGEHRFISPVVKLAG